MIAFGAAPTVVPPDPEPVIPSGVWPDVELVVTTHLRTVTGMPASTRLPNDLVGSMPRHRVTAAGGDDDDVTDTALVDVETFAATREQARDAAALAREAMLSLEASVAAGALVDTVRTVSRPSWVDYQNRDVQRFVASYRVQLRRS